MTSATRLTEAEKIKLEEESLWERIEASSEWESMWERIGASLCKIQREQEAKLDKIFQDLRSMMETKDASSGSCKSQLELPKFSDDLDFQKSIDVDRAIVDEDLMEQHSSGRYEEMDIELEIGVEDCAGVLKEIEDVEFLEVAVTPLQKTEEMEVFMPLPHDEKSTEVKKESDLEQDKLKGTELLSHARHNAPVSELSVVLPVSTCYNLSLSWLLNWFPRPMVKLKFMAQNDEEMGGEGNVRRASAKAGEDRILVVAAEELGWLLDRDYDASRINKIFDVESGEVKKMEHVLDNLTIFGKEKGTIISDILIATNELKDLIMSVQEDLASSGEVLSQQPDVDAKDEWSADKEETYGAISGARWAERFLLKAAFNNSPYHLFIWLLVRVPKPKVRMKLMKFVSRDIYEEEFTNLDMADKKGPT